MLLLLLLLLLLCGRVCACRETFYSEYKKLKNVSCEHDRLNG